MADDLILPAGITLNGGDVLGAYDVNTWIPALTFGGGNTGITYGTRSGRRILIGDFSIHFFRLTLTNKGSSTGAALITGMLDTVLNDAALPVVGSLRASNLTFSGIPTIAGAPNTTTANLQMFASGGAAADITDTAFANNTTLIGWVAFQIEP